MVVRPPKFGGSVDCRTKDVSSVRLDLDQKWVDEVGYHIVADKASPSDLTILTSAIS